MVIKGKYPAFEGNVLAKHASIVLVSSGFERLAYYTMTGSLTVFFSRELGMESVLAQQMQATFQSIVYMMPILGAFIADTWTGRYSIVAFSLALACIGSAGMVAGAATDISWLSLLSLFVFFAAPIAMVKPNLIVLGADQFNEKSVPQMKQRDTFFSAYYWMTNVAAAIAFLIMSQIAVEGMGAVTKSWSYSFVFGCGTVYCLISLSVIVGGSKRLFVNYPAGSSLTGFAKVTMASLKGSPSKNGYMVICGIALLLIAVIASIPSFFFDAPALDYVLAILIVLGCVFLIIFGRSADWVYHADVNSPGTFEKSDLQGARDVYRLAPYIAFVIPFWSVYNQMNTGFISQGCQMDNHLTEDFTVAPNTMPTFNSVVILIVIPIFNYGLYPCASKVAGGKFTLTPLRRIGLGFGVTALAMLVAAIIEYARRNSDILMTECTQDLVKQGWCTTSQIGTDVPELSSCYTYNDGTSGPVPKSSINLFWQVFSYGLVGVAEILVAITYFDFFYSQVPPFMRSVCQAIQMLTTSLGTMVGAVINSLCAGWLPNNLNEGNQEYMYFVNMMFGLAMLLIFAIVSRGFEYKPGTSLMPGDDAPRGGSRSSETLADDDADRHDSSHSTSLSGSIAKKPVDSISSSDEGERSR